MTLAHRHLAVKDRREKREYHSLYLRYIIDGLTMANEEQFHCSKTEDKSVR